MRSAPGLEDLGRAKGAMNRLKAREERGANGSGSKIMFASPLVSASFL